MNTPDQSTAERHDTRIDDAAGFRGYVGSCTCGWRQAQKARPPVTLDQAYSIVLALTREHRP